jgi:cytidine deaminase
MTYNGMRTSKAEKEATVKICRVSLDSLPEEEVELLAAASATRTHARSLSGYLVGAAVRSAITERIYRGCNIEQLGEPTTCAERVASYSLIAAEGPEVEIAALAVVAGPAEKDASLIEDFSPVRWVHGLPIPCERCTRMIWENCNHKPDVLILSTNAEGELVYRTRIIDLLPGFRLILEWLHEEER